MIIDRDDRAVFTHQLCQRRRGRPRAVPTVATSVKLPEPVFDALCREAQRTGSSLHATLREALTQYADAGHFGSQTNHGAPRAW